MAYSDVIPPVILRKMLEEQRQRRAETEEDER
jgi:hypothetical protein